jgi:hypothetical protein
MRDVFVRGVQDESWSQHELASLSAGVWTFERLDRRGVTVLLSIASCVSIYAQTKPVRVPADIDCLEEDANRGEDDMAVVQLSA